ncbi:MAG: transcription elongation factor 1 family protein [Candidatus Hermodarchaeota archaeon]
MGRRKRKQQTYKRVKRVPKIFNCPSCGEKSVKVENIRKSAIATVKCGHCGLTKDVLVNSISEPVDAFGDFIDVYYADQEIYRLEKRVPKLIKENEWGELSLCYSILSDICRAKAAEAMEDEDNIDMDEVQKWKIKSEEYKRKEKDALLKLDSSELEKGIKTDDESLFTEHDESDMKKEKKIEDVFDDPGFLEW